MADWWQSDPVADPSFTGVIPGRTKPKEPEVRQVGRQLGIVDPTTGSFTPTYTAPGENDEEDPAKAALSNAIKGLGIEELLVGVNRARGAVKGGYATGVTGAVLGMIPGTTAADFRSEGGYLDQIQGGVIMEKLQALKEASKTGASGMGALSEREGARMAASVAALGPKMSDEALLNSLNDIERHAKVLQAVSDGLDPRDPATMKKYGIPKLDADIWGTTGETAPEDNTAREQGAESAAGLADMTDAQKASYEAFWKSNPDPTADELQAWATANRIGKLGNAGEIIKAAKEGRGYSTAVDREEAVRAEVAAQDAARGAPDSPTEALLRQGTTLGLADEAAGVGRGVSRALQGENPIEGYKLGRDAERLRVDDARQQLGYAGTAIEIAGGLASANPTSALAGLTARQVVREGARGGAAGGALAGFGSGEGLEDSVLRAGVGAGAGAALGAGIGALSNRFAPRGMDPALADLSAAENVRISQPMIEGNRRAVNRAGVLEADPSTAPVIQQGFADTATDIETGVGRLATGGVASERGAAGESVQRAARRFITRSRNVANQLYDRARNLAGDATITPRESLTQLREEVRQLSETPNVNQGELAFINEIGEDLTRGPLSVDAVRGLRTSIRGRISEQGLTATQAEARAMRIIDSLGRDAQASLPADASNAFRRADAFYRERMVHIDDVLDRWIGGRNGVARLSGEQVFDKIKTMANSDGRRLAAVMRSLDPQERLDVAATIAQSLGRRGPDDPFSVDLFVSQSRKLSPSARRTVFGAGGAQSIENLVTLSQRLQQAQGQVNRSRTGRPVTNAIRGSARTLIAGLMGTGGALAGGGSVTGGLVGLSAAGAAMLSRAGLRALSARSLMSPRVSRWLAETADVNTPAQAQIAYRRLGTIIAREPTLASELQPLHRWLTEAVNPAPALAGEGEGDDERR